MTLVLSWVVPDGIVIGADSALTFSDASGKTSMTLADAYKLIPYGKDGKSFGVAFYGLAKLKNDWTSNWLQQYVDKCPPPKKIEDLAQQLAADLNALGLNDKEPLGMHVAGWDVVNQTAEGIEPRLFEVSNVQPATAAVSLYFAARDLLPAGFVDDVRKYRSGDHGEYPMHFASAGVPISFSTNWIAQGLIPAQTAMVGSQVPHQDIASVAEYVRFLIGMVADTQRIARQHATVNRPVETLILFPTATPAVSTRY